MRPEKQSMIEEIRRNLMDSSFVILADYQGLNVAKLDDLRGRLRGANARLQVVQNRMFQRVARDLNYKGFETRIRGPSAMVYGTGDIAAVARVLRDFTKEHERPKVTLGALNGEVLSREQIEQLAALPPREILLAQMVGLLAQPLRGIVGVLHHRLASLIYVLKAYEEKKKV